MTVGLRVEVSIPTRIAWDWSRGIGTDIIRFVVDSVNDLYI